MLGWPKLILAGAELGLAAGAGCLAFCAPVAGAAMLASGERGGRGGARSLGSFLLGRLAGYLVFGSAAGALGRMVAWDPGSPVALAAGVLLAAALIATGFAAGRSAWFELRLCPAAGARLSRLPLALGFLSGLNVCPAFVLAGREALGAGGALGGESSSRASSRGRPSGSCRSRSCPWYGSGPDASGWRGSRGAVPSSSAPPFSRRRSRLADPRAR